MLKVYQAADLPEAYLLLHRFEERRIPARVLNENLQGAVGEIPFTQAWPEVWIEDERDLALAQALVAEFENRPRHTGTLVCNQCGENNPATFETCWHCGDTL